MEVFRSHSLFSWRHLTYINDQSRIIQSASAQKVVLPFVCCRRLPGPMAFKLIASGVCSKLSSREPSLDSGYKQNGTSKP